MGNFCLQSGNSIICGGQGTVIVVDCSIEHLIDIVLEGMSGISMHILQHQHLNFIPGGVLRVCAVPDKCFPVFSIEVSEGNSNGKVGKGQYFYFK